MTHDELLILASKSTSKILLENTDFIAEKLVKNIEDEEDINDVFPKLVANAIGIATQISVQTTITLLENFGLIIPQDFEKPLEKPLLKIVWNASDHQGED